MFARNNLTPSPHRSIQCHYRVLRDRRGIPPQLYPRAPWIHMMKVIPPGYHQLLQYPTPSGTADIRDQAMSWSNAAIAQKKFGCMEKNARVASNQSHPRRKSRNRSQLNSNHRAAGAERQTPPTSQWLQIVDRRKTRSWSI